MVERRVLLVRGGQVLVSEVARAVGGSLAGVEFRDAGRKQLKGIKGRQRVFEVVWREEGARKDAAIA